MSGNSIVGAAERVGSAVVAALPPAFLLLVLLNIVFLGLVLWFEARSTDTKLAILNRVLDSCMQRVEHSQPVK